MHLNSKVNSSQYQGDHGFTRGGIGLLVRDVRPLWRMEWYHGLARGAPLSESLTLQLNAQAQVLQRQGIKVINLTAGELDFTTPQFIQQTIHPSTKETTGLPVEELVSWYGMFAPCGVWSGTTGLPVGLHWFHVWVLLTWSTSGVYWYRIGFGRAFA